MSGVNRTVVIGRLTADVEVRKTQSGLSVAKFTIACDRPKQKDGESKADFIPCTAWRGSADFLGNYGRKGCLIGVDGRLQSGSYEDKDGRKVYTLDVIADSVQLLSKPQAQNRSEPKVEERYEVRNETPLFTNDAVITSDDLPF